MNIDLYYEVFDEKFYNKNYRISKTNDKKILFKHWIEQGKKQDFVINEYQLKNRLKINIEHNNKLLDLLEYTSKDNITFNILIRTSDRPGFFKKCIESVLNQTYKGKVNIYVTCDTQNTLNYVTKYKNINIIKVKKIEKEYWFNLYCNILLDIVKDGWMIFLDDDDMFITDNALDIISSNISSEFDLIIWNYLRPDKIISPNNNFVMGEIDTTCFCFHSKHKNKSKWIDRRGGDFYFYKKLDENVNFKKQFINLSLVKTILENSIASYGLKI